MELIFYLTFIIFFSFSLSNTEDDYDYDYDVNVPTNKTKSGGSLRLNSSRNRMLTNLPKERAPHSMIFPTEGVKRNRERSKNC